MLNEYLDILPAVAQALADGKAVVALESTVITHGLPYPQNRDLALAMEDAVRALGAIPATLAVLDGRLAVGITPDQLERLAQAEQMHKISRREIGPALALGWSGGTTVAGTMIIAHAAGIRVFATGGIGGVHRQPLYDVSADLPELGRTPVLVVCAGAKSILNLDATLEYLETAAVPVVGYQTNDFPAFFARSSGLPVSVLAESPAQAAAIARRHWQVPGAGGVLVANPPPIESALPHEQIDEAIAAALVQAEAQGVRGQAVTPFLLASVNQLTAGASLQANLALLLNNARLAAQIALELV